MTLAEKLIDEVARAIHEARYDDPYQRASTPPWVNDAARAAISVTLNAAARVAEANVPRNEPGEYWDGRFRAADEIRALLP